MRSMGTSQHLCQALQQGSRDLKTPQLLVTKCLTGGLFHDLLDDLLAAVQHSAASAVHAHAHPPTVERIGNAVDEARQALH